MNLRLGFIFAMMGYSHTVSAAAAWLALHQFGLVEVGDTQTLVVTTLACAGAGMLPDIDHKNGTIAHSIPPVSSLISAVVSKISGGHRKGTHSLLGILCFWMIAWGAERLTYNGIPWLSLFIAGYVGGLALRILGAPGGWLGALALGWGAWYTDSLSLLPLAMAIGATVHIMGDAMTTRGVNPFYPLTFKPIIPSRLWRKSGYMALPVLGDAGSGHEKLLTSLLTLYCIYAGLVYFGLWDQILRHLTQQV